MDRARGTGGGLLLLLLLACGRVGYQAQGVSGGTDGGGGAETSALSDSAPPAEDAQPLEAAPAMMDAVPDQGPTSGALLLHWRFDEASGDVAVDSAGRGLHGQYTGSSGIPQPSTSVPGAVPANPLSRTFQRIGRHAVQLASMPPALKVRRELTVLAWYQAADIDTNGSEILSGGDHYVLRIKYGSQIELGKRVATLGGTGVWVQCLAPVTGHLDGRWHHLAGVFHGGGMDVYFDGEHRCRSNDPREILYDLASGSDLWVGRHSSRGAGWDFQGNLDDLRIYGRALPESEIRSLVSGLGR